jgi:uncharacterized cupin superfamily protein
MHEHIGNRLRLKSEFIDDSNALQTSFHLGKAGGSQQQYACIDRLAPGAKSCKYHCHSKQEEFFLILKGTVKLRAGNEFHTLSEGDFFCKPAGKGIAHQFINESSEQVEILDVGTKATDDKIDYPDEGVSYYPSSGKAFRDGVELPGWSTDPN